MIKAALRAPDHGKMKPYHFVVIEKAECRNYENV
ncbi:nitroreductase [Actinobacillus equuli]|nr:nitroreductase [Actinobacillus equuli]